MLVAIVRAMAIAKSTVGYGNGMVMIVYRSNLRPHHSWRCDTQSISMDVTSAACLILCYIIELDCIFVDDLQFLTYCHNLDLQIQVSMESA